MREEDATTDPCECGRPAEEEGAEPTDLSRRDLLKKTIGLAVLLPVTGIAALDVTSLAWAQSGELGSTNSAASTQTDPTKLPPQVGDLFVHSSGIKKGQLVKGADLDEGGPQIVVWPAEVTGGPGDPKVKVVRDGNSQNKVLLARFQVDRYSAGTKKYVTADGVVAYAATCTHQCCVVSEWEAAKTLFLCPCHGSQYDPLDGAQETPGSPAPRPLPQLPLKAAGASDVYPAVAAGFITTVGCGPIRH